MKMIERVARVNDPVVWHMYDEGATQFGCDSMESTIKDSLKKAKAVIKTMREPSEEMTAQGSEVTIEHVEFGEPDAVANDTYQAMIDKALEE